MLTQLLLLVCGVWLVLRLARTLLSPARASSEQSHPGVEIPKVVSKWPGNVDILWKATSEKTSDLPGQYIADLADKYGDTINCNFLGSNIIYTQDPDLIRHVMVTNQNNYPKGSFLNECFRDVCVFATSLPRASQTVSRAGGGIFNTDGEEWKIHRNAARPFFQKENISDFTVYHRHASRFMDKIAALTEGNKPIEIHDPISRFTLDSSTDFIFGVSVNSIKTAGEPIETDYLVAFDSIQLHLAKRINRDRFWWWFEMFHNPNEKYLKVLTKLVNNTAEGNLETKGSAIGDAETLLRILSPKWGNDPQMMRDELLNVLMAARDTTASMIASLVYEFARHPEAWVIAREECFGLLGNDGLLAYEDVKRLRFLRAAINETLRMYPPISANSRVSQQDDLVKLAGIEYHIPKWTHVGWSVLQLQRRKDHFGEDAHEWKPNRWLAEDGLNPASAAFQAWGYGPRLCIGQEIAYLEASVLLCRMLQKYKRLELAPDAQPPDSYLRGDPKNGIQPIAPVITLKMKGGIWIRLLTE